MEKINAVIAALAALGIATTFTAPVSTTLTKKSTEPYYDPLAQSRALQRLEKMDKAINVNITGINMTSPGATRDAVLSGIKYGTALTIAGSA